MKMVSCDQSCFSDLKTHSGNMQHTQVKAFLQKHIRHHSLESAANIEGLAARLVETLAHTHRFESIKKTLG